MKVNTLHQYPFTADFYKANYTSDGVSNSLTYQFVTTVTCLVASRGAIGQLDLIAPIAYAQGSQFRDIKDRKGEYVYPVAQGGAAYMVKYVEPILDVFGDIDGYKHTLTVA